MAQILSDPIGCRITEAKLSFAERIIEAAMLMGVKDFIICPGSRNSALVQSMIKRTEIRCYFWFEERSAAFFALGKCRALRTPVAVITTSGTAAGELLPAAMEAYYSGDPLLLITADRPKAYRGTGAPQCAEQHSLFGCYTPFSYDLSEGDLCDLTPWTLKNPCHLNVCLEDPMRPNLSRAAISPQKNAPCIGREKKLESFLEQANNLLVVVGTLGREELSPVMKWLQKLGAPLYCEGPSLLRGREELAPLALLHGDNMLEIASDNFYPIDAILRIGGVPTTSLWRDMEEHSDKVAILSISSAPFSGSPCSDLLVGNLAELFSAPPKKRFSNKFLDWWQKDKQICRLLADLIKEQPRSEPSLFWDVVRQIPENSLLYLGNSSPIRHFDLALHSAPGNLEIKASRGLNGIDGQLATFFGLCAPDKSCWAIVGDLTALYDLAAPWILQQLPTLNVTIVVINNGGGKIFQRMFQEPEFLNNHTLSFKGIAEMWGLKYLKNPEKPLPLEKGSRLIEICPDEEQTKRFWKNYRSLAKI